VIKISEIIVILTFIIAMTLFLLYMVYLFKEYKRLVRIIEGIGYIALVASVGWNIIYEITKSTIDGGQYFVLNEQLKSIWIYLDHLTNFISFQNVNLLNEYSQLNEHLISLKDGEKYAREQYNLARYIQWFLAAIATSCTAVGKICDIIYKDKEDLSSMIDAPTGVKTATVEIKRENDTTEQQNLASNDNEATCVHRYTLSVFKDMYYHELTTKEGLNSRVSVPLTTLSIIATLIVYYISKSEGLPSLTMANILLCMYYFITILIICLILYAAILLLQVFYGHRYAESPSPKVIDDYAKQVEQYYACCGEAEKDIKIAQDINSYINDLYRDATDENLKNNHKKIKYIRRSNICIIIALLLCILNAIPLFLLNKCN